MEPKIINLSNTELTNDQINVLKLGLKFSPTPKQNNMDLKADINEFSRKLRLKEFWHNRDSTNDGSIVRNKKGTHINRGRNLTLDKFIDFINNYPLDNNEHKKRFSNLSYNHRTALNQLAENRDIIIKQADKGGATVIMDVQYYKKLVLDQLEDSTFYKEIPENDDQKVLKKISKLVDEQGRNLTKDEKDFLLKFECKTSNFYGLPKIHKSKIILSEVEKQNSEYIKILQPNDLKLRPIVAGPSCPSHRLSNVIDISIKNQELCKG